jgi:hypothetical protein
VAEHHEAGDRDHGAGHEDANHEPPPGHSHQGVTPQQLGQGRRDQAQADRGPEEVQQVPEGIDRAQGNVLFGV